jgi:hypothetical protein
MENFVIGLWKTVAVRWIVGAAAVLLTVGALVPASAGADPLPPDVPPGTPCNDAWCTPGIAPNIVLGSYCDNFTYYAFGVTSWGRLVFCGSPRRYEPRWFRSPSMDGVKNLGDDCVGHENHVAQGPDGMFLFCLGANGRTSWVRGDT